MVAEYAKKEEDHLDDLQLSRQADRIMYFLLLLDDERHQQARLALGPLFMQAAYPYFEYDKVCLAKSLTSAIKTGIDKSIPETQTSSANRFCDRYCFQTGPEKFSIKEGLDIADVSKFKNSPLDTERQTIEQDAKQELQNPSQLIGTVYIWEHHSTKSLQ